MEESGVTACLNSHLSVDLSSDLLTPIFKREQAVSKMGHNSDKMYVTHAEHSAGNHTASSNGKRQENGKSEFLRLPL